MSEVDPEILRRYEALDDEGKWAVEEIGQLLLDAIKPRDEEIVKLRAALESIAKNTCCDGCQEAARVAAGALK